MLTDQQVSTIAKHFIVACIWADCEEGTHPRETKAAIATAEFIVRKFYKINARVVDAVLRIGKENGYGSHPDAGSPEAAFGHDMYLTSQGHGANIMDRSELPHYLRENLSYALDQFRHRGESWTYDYEFYRGWLYLHTRGKQ